VPFPEESVYKEVIEEKPLPRVKMFYNWSIIILQYNKVNFRVSIFSSGIVFLFNQSLSNQFRTGKKSMCLAAVEVVAVAGCQTLACALAITVI